MKRLGRLVSLFLLVPVVGVLPMRSVQAGHQRQAAGFTCGPHMLTYFAKQRVGVDMGDGVRCVLINPNVPANAGVRVPKLVWYGEGWNENSSGVYRHVGVAYQQLGKKTLLVYAAEIGGNGEVSNEVWYGGVYIHVVHGHLPAPTVMDIISTTCGCWRERWTLAQSVPYTSYLKPLKYCGPNFIRYWVSYSGNQGWGVRCAFLVNNKVAVWLGRGSRGGLSYLQIGYRTAKGFGATDLCDPIYGRQCILFPGGSIHLKKDKVTVQTKKGKRTRTTRARLSVNVNAPGARWNETWVKVSS